MWDYFTRWREIAAHLYRNTLYICIYVRHVRTYVCVFATTATETERVKVAESAGQHESTGNVSRELGVGVTAASLWMRREGDGDGVEVRGNARARAYTRACKVAGISVCVMLIILHTAHASRPRVALRARARGEMNPRFG